MLLQVLDDILTDSVGRKVDFKNTVIIIMTLEQETKDFGNGVGFDTKDSENKNTQDVLKKV